MTTASVQGEGAVLFTDLVGFTSFNQSEGDEAALAVLDQQTRLMTDALAGRPGTRIVKELGDGLLVWCDAAAHAVVSAGALLTAVREARAGGTFPLAIRMGLHHGEVLRRGDDVVGLTVNVAARIVDLAGPGELLLSEAAVSACGPVAGAAFEPVGPVRVKGVREPLWLSRLAFEASARLGTVRTLAQPGPTI